MRWKLNSLLLTPLKSKAKKPLGLCPSVVGQEPAWREEGVYGDAEGAWEQSKDFCSYVDRGGCIGVGAESCGAQAWQGGSEPTIEEVDWFMQIIILFKWYKSINLINVTFICNKCIAALFMFLK